MKRRCFKKCQLKIPLIGICLFKKKVCYRRKRRSMRRSRR